MRRRWIVPLLGLAVLLTGVWGYSQLSIRRRWENRAETQYQRAFIDLSNNLGGLETQLAKVSVSNSPRFLRQSLADIWRLAYAAQEKMGQLPIGAVELTRMKMLLAKVGAFSYRVTDRPADTLRLTSAEWQTLQGLRDQTRYVSGQVTTMQANIIQNNLRWVDVDRLSGAQMTAAALARRLGTNKMTKSLVMVENGLKRMPDPGFPESNVIFKPKPKSLAGAKKVTSAEGSRIAARFVGGPGARLTTKYLGRIRGEMPSFLYTVTPRSGRDAATFAPTRVSITEQGGKVAWMLAERPVGARRVNLTQATDAARRFVTEKGLTDMEVVTREEFGAVDVITMCPKVNGVLYYPEAVKVQVAMDTGKVIGYEGVPYLTFHDPNRAPAGAVGISEAEARRLVSPSLQIENVRKAVVLGTNNQEQLCYQVDGRMKNERFLVYISAKDGSEVKIRRVDANGVEID